MIKNENYIVIRARMRTELNLRGNELLLFALIESFCRDGGSYTGSLAYLQEWIGQSKKTISRTLSSLCEKGLLVKDERNEGGKKVCVYRTKSFGDVDKMSIEADNISPRERKKCPSNVDKSSLNNNRDNIVKKNTNNGSVDGMEKCLQKKYDSAGRFPPTYDLAKAEAKAAQGAPVYKKRQGRRGI